MLLYYITDRKQFDGSDTNRRAALLRRIEEAAKAGVDLIELREKDLSIAELERLAVECVRIVREQSSTTRLLINSRTDVAMAVGADGVHLTGNDISASEARTIWDKVRTADATRRFTFGVSCHSPAEVRRAESHGADFVVLAPIFEKSGTDARPLGVESLKNATIGQVPDLRVEAGDNRVGVPVLALGGVTVENAADCIQAGAAGVAGIRLFQMGDLRETVLKLRTIQP